MSDESLDIPIGADLSDLQKAFSQIQGHVVRMGERVNKSLGKSNSAFARTSTAGAKIGKVLTKAWQTATRAARRAFTGMISAARGALSKIGGFFRSMIPKMGFLGPLAGLTALVGGFLSVRGAARGFKEALDLGGQLSDLSARTGAAVEDLAILQTAFEQNGVGADQVGNAINRLQRSISDINSDSKITQDTFKKLGLDLAVLRQMSPAKQFDAVAKSIAKLPNPTDRAAAAMAIFGRTGAQLITLFKDGNAIDNAAQNLGLQAVLLGKNAALFDRLADILLTAGNKLRGLFIGLADQLAPVIAPMMEAFDRIDLTGFGQTVGAAIRGLLPTADRLVGILDRVKATASNMGNALHAALAALQTGNALKFFAAGFELAIVNGLNKLAAGIGGVMAFLKASLGGIMSGASKAFKESGIESFLVGLFNGLGNLIAAKVKEAMAQAVGAFNNSRGKEILASSRADEARAENYFTLANAALSSLDIGRGMAAGAQDFADAMTAGQEAFRNATAKPWLDPSIAQQKMTELRETLREQMEKNAEAAREAAAAMNNRTNQPTPGDEGYGDTTTPQSPLGTLTTSLGRVGGGGFGMTFFPMISEQKRSNNILARIEKNTKNSGKIPVLV